MIAQGFTQDHNIEVFKAVNTSLGEAYGIYCHTCRQHLGTVHVVSVLMDRALSAADQAISDHLEAADAALRDELRGWLWYDFWGSP